VRSLHGAHESWRPTKISKKQQKWKSTGNHVNVNIMSVTSPISCSISDVAPAEEEMATMATATSPAMQRVANAGLSSLAAAEFEAVVELRGDLGLTFEARSTPAPPPAPSCRVKTIRPGSPASKAVPPIQVGDWVVSVQGQPVANYFAAMNKINTAPVRAAAWPPTPAALRARACM
jgi:hypothetical protein